MQRESKLLRNSRGEGKSAGPRVRSVGGRSEYVDLGDLSGIIGNQNYEIPESVDLATYDTVVIWCVRFSVAFGQGELMIT